MGWNEYARSKTPLKLVFLLIAAVLINALIIECFRIASLYKYAPPIDSAVLSQMNEEFENAVILDSMQDQSAHPLWEGDCTAYLLETESNNVKLAVVQKHFLLDRYRYMDKFTADVHAGEGMNAPISGTTYHQALCWINDGTSIESFNMGQNYGPTAFLAIIPMIIAEYIAYCLLFKREELL